MQPPIPPGGGPAPRWVVGRPPLTLAPGTVIGDKYRVEREIGRGSFGVVVRAVHLALRQPVAIKVLTDVDDGTDAQRAEDAERFRREALATAALRSDHVVRVLDVDVLKDGAPYIVMEHLEGETLYEAMLARGALRIDEAVDCTLQILAALAEAHAAGIVHRDLKPPNVFLAKGPSGAGAPIVKVLDFGVSKIRGGNAHAITQTGAVIGTVVYMAPEQVMDAKRVDARADLWSVAYILYEALTRQLPFGPMTSPALVTSILTKPPTPASVGRPDLPRELDMVLRRGLEKDPARRFQTAAEMGFALAPFASPRSHAALELLRRAPPPAGAAAPPLPSPPPMRAPSAPPPAAGPSAVLLPLVLAFVLTVAAGAVAIALTAKRASRRPTTPVVAPDDARRR